MTAKLVGDELTNELVNWSNEVDGTCRLESRDLWMFVFWAGSVAATARLVFGMVRVRRP